MCSITEREVYNLPKKLVVGDWMIGSLQHREHFNYKHSNVRHDVILHAQTVPKGPSVYAYYSSI